LDIVTLANCVLSQNCDAADDGGCSGDLNGDGGWNVLDIVLLVNCVLADNCGGSVDDTSDASEASSGVYFVQADAEGFVITQNLMLVK